jgi:hypothetical protein
MHVPAEAGCIHGRGDGGQTTSHSRAYWLLVGEWRAGGDSLRTSPPDTDTLEKLQEVFNALEEWDEYLRQNAPAFKAAPNGRGAKP